MKKIISVLIAVSSLSIIISCTTPNNSADINNSNEVNDTEITDNSNQNDETEQEPIDDSEKKYESFVLCENFEGCFKDLVNDIKWDLYINDFPVTIYWGEQTYKSIDKMLIDFQNDYYRVMFDIENIDGKITVYRPTETKHCSSWFIKKASFKQTSEGITITIYFEY